jgi:hypothetical protein
VQLGAQGLDLGLAARDLVAEQFGLDALGEEPGEVYEAALRFGARRLEGAR